MKKDIDNYVVSCLVCALAERWSEKTPGLLQAVASSTAPWKKISMDFIVELLECWKYRDLGYSRPSL